MSNNYNQTYSNTFWFINRFLLNREASGQEGEDMETNGQEGEEKEAGQEGEGREGDNPKSE